MKKIALFLAFLTFLPLCALAQDRVQHYAADKPAGVAAALAQIESSIADMEKNSKGADLEAVHEESYFLEAAIETLRKDPKAPTLQTEIDALANVTETIHTASEDGKGDVVNENLPKLKAAFDIVKAKLD